MAKIFAFLPGRALGDFIIGAVVASSIRELFDEGELFIYYRDDRPYKKHVTSCIRNVTGTFVATGPKAMLPIDLFDPPAGRIVSSNETFEKMRVKDADLILAGTMLHLWRLNAIPPATLRIPPENIVPSDNQLIALGIDPSKWIACVYWKEASYSYRWDDPKRVIYDPAPYIEVIRHVIEDLGGQVIRLGHPSPTEIPKMKGFLDLAKIEGSEWLQLYAVSVARFFVAVSSGPSAYGSAFGVPTVVTDDTMAGGAWNPHDYVVAQGILHDGKVFRQTEAYDAGCLFQESHSKMGFQYIRNTTAELVAATDEMFKSTANCLGWRQLPEFQPKLPRPNAVSLPMPRSYRRDLLIPPSQRA